MSQAVGGKIYCAADFMNTPRRLLEARRSKLYHEMPAPEKWHKDYGAGKIPFEKFTNHTPCIS